MSAMWKALASLALGVAGALYVNAHRPYAADPDDPGWTRLPCGLRVIVRPIEGATQVAVLTHFGIGADHDPDGRSGLAHLTEHLHVASAAGATPPRTVDEWNAKYGDANCCAETTQACTVYLTKVPPSSLDAEIADAAARMSDLRIEESDLHRERPRVLQQIAAFEAARPGRTPDQAGWIAAVKRIRRDRGPGVPCDVEAISLAEVRERMRRFYGPANARLVLTGAVDPSAIRLVAKYFRGLPGGERAPPVPERGPEHPGGRVEVDCGTVAPGAPIERSVWVAWPGPSRDDSDSIAMLLLERRASPPDEDYERRKLWPSSFFTDGVVLFRWTGDEVPLDDVVEAADELVAQFVAEPPTADEIDGIVRRVASSGEPFVPLAKFPEVIAVALADDATRHHDPDHIRTSLVSLTREDLARFAAKWLDPRNRVIAVARGPASPPLDESKLPPYLQEVLKQARSPAPVAKPK
jgi:predicted Zn-dependent peptidase